MDVFSEEVVDDGAAFVTDERVVEAEGRGAFLGFEFVEEFVYLEELSVFARTVVRSLLR